MLCQPYGEVWDGRIISSPLVHLNRLIDDDPFCFFFETVTKTFTKGERKYNMRIKGGTKGLYHVQHNLHNHTLPRRHPLNPLFSQSIGKRVG